MEYELWTQCPPRAPINRFSQVYAIQNLPSFPLPPLSISGHLADLISDMGPSTISSFSSVASPTS